MSEARRLFHDLEPPPGGLQRLRQRLQSTPSPRPGSRWYPMAAAGLALALLAALWLPGFMTRQRQDKALAQAVHDAVAPPTPGIRVIGGSAIALKGSQPGSHVYLLQMLPVSPPGDRRRDAPLFN